MDVTSYLGHIPQIESWIEQGKLDAMVLGLGPSAWLLRYCNRKLYQDIRLIGVHDACRILPVDDLVVMDSPAGHLHPDYERHKAIVNGRPKRLFVMDWQWKEWVKFLHPSMLPVAVKKKWWVWPSDVQRVTHEGDTKPALQGKKLRLVDEHPHTAFVSPAGATTLAWELGYRRIGIIGVDMRRNHHGTHQFVPHVDEFFMRIAGDAKRLGGAIVNLSPLTDLPRFGKWTPSASSSAPTHSNGTTGQNSCSSTASASTLAAASTSTGCELETSSSRSASTETLAPGS